MIRRAALILIVILCASFTWARSQEVPDSAMMYQTQEIWRNPKYNQRSLFFEVGFRNRQTAYRNFVKFMGCSPTEYIVRN